MPVNLDDMSDDEVMKLGPDAIQELQDQEEKEIQDEVSIVPGDDADDKPVNVSENQPAETPPEDDPVVPEENKSEASDDDKSELPSDAVSDGTGDQDGADEKSESAGDLEQKEADSKKSDDRVPAENEGEDTSDEKKTKVTKEEKAEDDKAAEVIQDFYTKVTSKFKADGRDIQIRTPEDAIRLMQMGVNYSRRMEELKPMRAVAATLEAHGLNDPAKLNELIDLSKGSPEAVAKFLKEKGIDPLDLDADKGDTHTTPNYQADPKDSAFQEAIDNTLATEGGKELLNDVNADWDDMSKEALRDSPSIFENLLAQKSSGVYEQIIGELKYQRDMGFLKDIPFLQAYHQVGDAMQTAGVLEDPTKAQSVAPGQPLVIDTGTRKAASKPKTVQPNPDPSSAKQPGNVATPQKDNSDQVDYASMSDADFMKLGAPS